MATANEMYNNFQIEYDRVSSEAAKGWLEDEVAYFINTAESDLLRQKTEAPDTADRQSYIFPFKVNKKLVLSSNQSGAIGPQSFLYEMPLDYPGRSEKEVVTYYNCDFISPVTPLTDDEYFSINLDIAKASQIEDLKRMLISREGNNEKLFELFMPKDNNFRIKNYLITYLREPRPIVIDLNNPSNQVNSEFAANKHVEIIRRAVFYALETAADSRLQTYPSAKPMTFYRGMNPQNN